MADLFVTLIAAAAFVALGTSGATGLAFAVLLLLVVWLLRERSSTRPPTPRNSRTGH